MNADDRARILAAQADRLKEACLTLSREALVLFDRLDQHGVEGAMDDGGMAVTINLNAAHEELRSYFVRQATFRLASTAAGRLMLGDILRAQQSDGTRAAVTEE